MDNIEKFTLLFSDFDLKIVSKEQTTPKGRSFELTNRLEPVNRTDTNDQKTKSELKKTLTRLMKEYKQAQKSFKHNKISRQELFDFEWRLFEIQEEIKKIEDQERGNTI
jgi:septal ring factor EnvC (AmiA/AmiB activator)